MLMVSFATSAWASCMADAGTPASAQMACCEAGHEKCPMHGSAEDCCKTEGQRQQQISVSNGAVARSTLTPPALVATIALLSFIPLLGRACPSMSSGDVLKDPAPPPYLLGSAFLI